MPENINFLTTTRTTVDQTPLITQDADDKSGPKLSETNHVASVSWRQPIRSIKLHFSDLSSCFTCEFITWIGIMQFFVGGGTFRLFMIVALPLFKEFGINAVRKQLYTACMISPFAMKPLVGVLSDLMPIRGYHKKYYCVLSILLGFLSCSLLTWCFQNNTIITDALSKGKHGAPQLCDFIVICFTAVSFEYATLELMMEGKYSEKMRLHPQSGSSIITYKLGTFGLGEILTQSFAGPLSDSNNWNVMFWIASIFAVIPLLPTLLGWLMEDKRVIEEQGMVKPFPGLLFDRGTFSKKQALFIIVFLSGLASPLASVVTVFVDHMLGLALSALLLLLLSLATYFMLPRTVFWTVIAVILLDLSFLNTHSALEYFYTADKTCLPNGPHFSYTYFITMSGIVGSISKFLAVILYETFMSDWKFHHALIFTILVEVISNVTDLALVLGWNKYIGIPDKFFFLMGSGVFESLTDAMRSIPKLAIFAKISPPQMESAVFAFIFGIDQFCTVLSLHLGSSVIQKSGMITVGVDCDFEQLPYLIIIFQMLVPLIIGIPATFLLPNLRQTEQYIDWTEEGWQESRHDDDKTSVKSSANEEEGLKFDKYLL